MSSVSFLILLVLTFGFAECSENCITCLMVFDRKICDFNDFRNYYQRNGVYDRPFDLKTTCHNESVVYGLNIDEIREFNTIPLKNMKSTIEIIDIPHQVLPVSYFTKCEIYNVLLLNGTHLQGLAYSSLNDFNNLETLYLNDNNLTKLTAGIFNSLIRLTYLDLSRNSIKEIGEHTFVGLAKLEVLLLAGNRITSIPDTIFISNIFLRTVSFSGNFLTKLPDIHQLSKIEELDLDNNMFSHIDSNYLKGALNLRQLKLAANNLTTVTSDVFAGLTSLQKLELQNNNLSSLLMSCFSDLSSLQLLNISWNRLESFEYGQFDRLTNLEYLDISHNQLRDLPLYLYHGLSNLKELNIENNLIKELNAGDIIFSLRNLQKIYLDGNVWDCTQLVKYSRVLSVRAEHGHVFNSSNVHGIACSLSTNISEDISRTDDVKISAGVSKAINENFRNSQLFKFFDKDFENSKFFRYIENLSIPIERIFNERNWTVLGEINGKFKDSFKELFKDFDDGFKNSTFFKYMESVKLPQPQLDENLNKRKESNENFKDSLMYKYFNEDFENSKFYKYMESLKKPQELSSNLDESRSISEKLVSAVEETPKTNENSSILKGILTVNILTMISLMCFVIYIFIYGNKKHVESRQSVELI